MRRPPKFVQGFIDRHGKPRFYFRRAGFKTIPLPALKATVIIQHDMRDIGELRAFPAAPR